MLLVCEDAEEQAEAECTVFLSASSVVIVGNIRNGSVHQLKIPDPSTSEKNNPGQNSVTKKENRNITWMEFSRDNQYLAITTENKQLVVFDKTFQIMKNIVLSRTSSKVCFSATNDILIADRTGDVYLYKMLDERNEPELLLGHLSVILDILITNCGKYVITCDRDEKIRVSHYPNAYNIATFCLGHSAFVTTLRLIKYNNVLLSASGDGTIRIWNYLEGKQINMIDTQHLIDKRIVEAFVSQMDSEKVDVTVLPITDIQIHEDESKGILAVSLYNVGKLFLFGINLKTLEYSNLESVSLDATIVSYCLSNKLYILTDTFKVYELVDNKIKRISYKLIEDKLVEYGDQFLNNNSDIILLYKRKYDNVQEYMERKKLRLETK